MFHLKGSKKKPCLNSSHFNCSLRDSGINSLKSKPRKLASVFVSGCFCRHHDTFRFLRKLIKYTMFLISGQGYCVSAKVHGFIHEQKSLTKKCILYLPMLMGFGGKVNCLFSIAQSMKKTIFIVII